MGFAILQAKGATIASNLEQRWTTLHTLVLCFLIPTLLRLIVIFTVDWKPFVDDLWYMTKATDIAAGHGYVHQGKPTAYFPVGYPALLGGLFYVVGPSLKAAQLLNVAMSVITIALVYWIALRQTKNRGIAALAAALMGYFPNQIGACVVTMSEIPCLLLITLGVGLMLRPSWGRAEVLGVLVGAVFGVATLVRTQSFLIPLFCVPLVVVLARRGKMWVRQTVARLAWVAAGFVVLAPWAARNHDVFGEFVLVATNGGDNLLIGNNPKATGACMGAMEVFPEDANFPALSELERDHLGKKLGREYILANPMKTIAMVPRKLWHTYRSDLGITNWLWEYNRQRGSVAYYLAQGVTQGMYMLVLFGAFMGFFLARRWPVSHRPLTYVTLAITAYFSLVSAVFFGDARFHQPMVPLFTVVAACTIYAGVRQLRERPATTTTPQTNSPAAAAG